LLLAAFFSYSVFAFHAFLGVASPYSLVAHGIAACAASNAIGILVIGRAGMESGFAAPMSAGLVMVVTLMSMGVSYGASVSWLPVASLLTDASDGTFALLNAAVWGAIAVTVFTRRATVQS
jgi:hypothetical protein